MNTDEFLTKIIDSLPVIFWAAEGAAANYRIAFWNREAESVYGYKARDAIGGSFIDLFVEPFLRERAAADCDAVIEGRFTHPSNVVTIDRDRNGKQVVLLTNVFRLSHNGKFYQAEVSLDLTESKLFDLIDLGYRDLIREADSDPEERQLSYLIERRLQRERNQVNKWAASVMHDVRSEVGSARDHLVSYENRRRVESNDRDLIHLNYLLRSLGFRANAFIGMYGGLRPGKVEDFDGRRVVESELSRLDEYGPTMFRASIEGKRTSGPYEPVMLRGRAEAFAHCVYNIMQNACRHMQPHPGGHRFVSTEAHIVGSYYVVTVVNPGTIADERDRDLTTDRTSLGLRLASELTSEVGADLLITNSTRRGRPCVRAKLSWPLASSALD